MSKVLPLLEEIFRHKIATMLGLPDGEWPDTTKEEYTEQEIQQVHTRIAIVGQKLLTVLFEFEARRRCRVCKSAKNYVNGESGEVKGLTYDLDPKPEYNGFELYMNYVRTGKDLPILCTCCEAVTNREATRVQNGYGGYTILDVPEYIRKEVRSEMNRRKGKESRGKRNKGIAPFKPKQVFVPSNEERLQKQHHAETVQENPETEVPEQISEEQLQQDHHVQVECEIS